MKKFDTTKLEQLEQQIADRTAQIAAAKVDVATAEENLASATNELEKALHGTDVDEGVRATVKEQMLKNQLDQRKRDLDKLEREQTMTDAEYRAVCKELSAICNEANDELVENLAKAIEKLMPSVEEQRTLIERTNRAMFDAKKHLVCDERMAKAHFSKNMMNPSGCGRYENYGVIQLITEIAKRCDYIVNHR